MQFNPRSNVALPVVPFYVSQCDHGSAMRMELSATERRHRTQLTTIDSSQDRPLLPHRLCKLAQNCRVAYLKYDLCSHLGGFQNPYPFGGVRRLPAILVTITTSRHSEMPAAPRPLHHRLAQCHGR